VQALEGVSLRVCRAEYIAITGPSGSGKSTLLHVLGTLLRPTGGDYVLCGRSTGHVPDRDLASLRLRKIGFVFQSYNLLEGLSAVENVAMPMKLAGIPKGKRLVRARELLGQVGLSDRQDHRPRQLSGGEEQRVAIARALANHPAMLLMDEPTGNLDSIAQASILDVLDSVRLAGTALVVVTHNPAVAERAGRVVSMIDGRLDGAD